MPSRSPLALFAALAVGAVACGSHAAEGGQTGGETPIRCSPSVQVDPLEPGADSPLGTSADDIVASLGGKHSATLTWSDATTTGLVADVTYDGRAGYSPSCKHNEVDVAVALSTDDGALAESLNAELFAASPDSGSFDVDVDASTLAGSFMSSHPPDVTYDQLTLSFHVELVPGAATGSIDGVGITAGQPEQDFQIASF
jgi:hypothetical protein